jgi:hypothetical protein
MRTDIIAYFESGPVIIEDRWKSKDLREALLAAVIQGIKPSLDVFLAFLVKSCLAFSDFSNKRVFEDSDLKNVLCSYLPLRQEQIVAILRDDSAVCFEIKKIASDLHYNDRGAIIDSLRQIEATIRQISEGKEAWSLDLIYELLVEFSGYGYVNFAYRETEKPVAIAAIQNRLSYKKLDTISPFDGTGDVSDFLKKLVCVSITFFGHDITFKLLHRLSGCISKKRPIPLFKIYNNKYYTEYIQYFERDYHSLLRLQRLMQAIKLQAPEPVIHLRDDTIPAAVVKVAPKLFSRFFKKGDI